MNRSSDERGAATVEFALITPILLIIMLSVVEFGRIYERQHAIISVSRESANIAARGATLQQAVQSALTSASDIKLAENGGVIATKVTAAGTKLTVTSQYTSTGYAGKSRIGVPGGNAAGLAARNLASGQSCYIVEVFYRYAAVTPLNKFAGIQFPSTLYERSVF